MKFTDHVQIKLVLFANISDTRVLYPDISTKSLPLRPNCSIRNLIASIIYCLNEFGEHNHQNSHIGE